MKAIIGIVVAIVALLIGVGLVLFLILFISKRRRRRKQRKDGSSQNEAHVGEEDAAKYFGIPTLELHRSGSKQIKRDDEEEVFQPIPAPSSSSLRDLQSNVTTPKLINIHKLNRIELN
jgi:hypothetical protein